MADEKNIKGQLLRDFIPVQPVYPPLLLRDFLSGAYSLATYAVDIYSPPFKTLHL